MKKSKKESVWKKAVSADTERQEKQASKLGYFMLPKNVHLFKEVPGSKVKLDFLPYVVTDAHHPDRNEEYGVAVVGEQWYKRPFRIHRGIGAGNEYVVCPTSVGKKCPICEYRAKRQKEGAPKEELQALNATHRNLYIVIPKGVKDFEEKPHVWEMSQFLFQDKLNEEIKENEEVACFPSLEEGKTVRIRFTEEVFAKNKYAAVGRIDFEDRDEYPESLLNEVPNLDEVLQILSYKELEAKFYEVEVAEDEDEEDDKPKKKNAIKTLDEDDDDEEEEEEVKPVKKKAETPALTKKAPAKKVDEDDDEDEDEDEEDTPPAPKRKPVRQAPVKEVVDDDEDDDDSDEDDDDEEDTPPKNMVKVKCVACNGTGKNSKGGKCLPCQGKGYKFVPSKKSTAPINNEDDDDEEDTPPPKKETKVKEKQVCPKKHVFGEDNDAFDDCTSCKIWDDCYEASA